jgi:hypothetical protein
MAPVKPPMDTNSRTSASAVDADSSLEAQKAAERYSADIDEWTNPKFGGGGRHQLQRDPSFGRPEKRTGR